MSNPVKTHSAETAAIVKHIDLQSIQFDFNILQLILSRVLHKALHGTNDTLYCLQEKPQEMLEPPTCLQDEHCKYGDTKGA